SSRSTPLERCDAARSSAADMRPAPGMVRSIRPTRGCSGRGWAPPVMLGVRQRRRGGGEEPWAGRLNPLWDCDPDVLPRARCAALPCRVSGEWASLTFNGKVLAGAIRSRTALRLVEEWALLHGPELEANWRRVQTGEPLERIPPLE